MKPVADLLQVTARIHRACLTVGAAFRTPKPRGYFSTWPTYVLDFYDAEDWGAHRTDEAITRRLIQPPRFVPTAREVDDALPALGLLNGFQPPPTIGGSIQLAFRVIRLRALQEWYGEHRGADESGAHWRGGWRAIGALAKCSRETSRKIHHAAMVYAYSRAVEGAN